MTLTVEQLIEILEEIRDAEDAGDSPVLFNNEDRSIAWGVERVLLRQDRSVVLTP